MINKDANLRTSLTLPKDLKSKLKVLAERERRSVNNLIVNALYIYTWMVNWILRIRKRSNILIYALLFVNVIYISYLLKYL